MSFNVYKYPSNFFGPSRCSFSPLLNDKDPKTNKAGIRYHYWLSAFFLRLMGKIVAVSLEDKSVVYLNKGSLKTWLKWHGVEARPGINYQAAIQQVIDRLALASQKPNTPAGDLSDPHPQPFNADETKGQTPIAKPLIDPLTKPTSFSHQSQENSALPHPQTPLQDIDKKEFSSEELHELFEKNKSNTQELKTAFCFSNSESYKKNFAKLAAILTPDDVSRLAGSALVNVDANACTFVFQTLNRKQSSGFIQGLLKEETTLSSQGLVNCIQGIYSLENHEDRQVLFAQIVATLYQTYHQKDSKRLRDYLGLDNYADGNLNSPQTKALRAFNEGYILTALRQDSQDRQLTIPLLDLLWQSSNTMTTILNSSFFDELTKDQKEVLIEWAETSKKQTALSIIKDRMKEDFPSYSLSKGTPSSTDLQKAFKRIKSNPEKLKEFLSFSNTEIYKQNFKTLASVLSPDAVFNLARLIHDVFNLGSIHCSQEQATCIFQSFNQEQRINLLKGLFQTPLPAYTVANCIEGINSVEQQEEKRALFTNLILLIYNRSKTDSTMKLCLNVESYVTGSGAKEKRKPAFRAFLENYLLIALSQDFQQKGLTTPLLTLLSESTSLMLKLLTLPFFDTLTDEQKQVLKQWAESSKKDDFLNVIKTKIP